MKDSEGKDKTRKKEILDAARQCFAQHGYAKTTLDDIGHVVGIKTGSLYHYYDGKEAIFRDVVAKEGEEMLDWLEGEMSKVKTSKDKILRYTQARLEYFQEVINLLDVSIQVIIEIRPFLDKLYSNFLRKESEVLQAVLNKGIASAEFKECKTVRIARAILLVSESIKFNAFNESNIMSASEFDYTELEQETAYIIGLILAGITK